MYEIRDVKGYEGLYKVDTNGVVYRVPKTRPMRPVGTQHPETGYVMVTLCKDSNAITKPAHRIVAEAFIENPDNKPVIDHIDEDKTNNAVSNLRWATVQENAEYYCTKDGRRHQKEVLKAYKSKLKEYELLLMNRTKEIAKLETSLLKTKKELEISVQKLKEQEVKFEAEKVKHTEHIKTLVESIKARPVEGYANTKGIKFSSINELVEVTGKPIKINGKEFKSCRAATDYILSEEILAGREVKLETIRRELRRYQQGLRPSWYMYGKYLVE